MGFPLRQRARRPDRQLARRLSRLDLGAGPATVERLEGGISNHNFVVTKGNNSYVARLCDERPLLGIDRRSEFVCHRVASELGIAPEVVHHESGLLVTRFVAGRTLTPADVRQPDSISRLAKLLRQLHDAWTKLTGQIVYFCPFQAVRTYARTASNLKADLPGDIDRLLADAGALAGRIAPFRPVLCHNDMLAANFIDDSGGRLWLVDWEYAGIGHPLFDLANLSANAAFSDEQDRALLAAYDGRVEPGRLIELCIFKAMSSLRESLWSTIQTVASEIRFDYDRYAADNLAAYRAARSRLEDHRIFAICSSNRWPAQLIQPPA
jgi:thiamine kinase-like enzyme